MKQNMLAIRNTLKTLKVESNEKGEIMHPIQKKADMAIFISVIFTGKNTGVGCRFVLQGIFPTQGSNPCLRLWQVYSLPLSHLRSPRTHIIYLSAFGSTFRKRRSWHPVPPLHGKQMGKQWKQCKTLFFWAPKSLQMVTAAMKLKDAYSLEGKL